MIYAQLWEVLSNQGLEEIESIGQKFDPNFHEAVGQIESNQYEEGIIAQEISKGYILRGKVIKPAKVLVAKAKEKGNEEDEKIRNKDENPSRGNMLKRYGLALAVLVVLFFISQQCMAEEIFWGNDVLVHEGNRIYDFGMDQADKDTLILIVSDSSATNLKDTLYIYRSMDDGKTWSFVDELVSRDDNYRFGKADVIAAKGNSDFVFVFWIYDSQLWYARYPYDFSSGPDSGMVSGVGENVVDFKICQNLFVNYYLFVIYQTDQDSVIFKRSTDFANTWTHRKNLTEITPITSQPSVAWSRYLYLVVAGKTSDDKVYTIRNNSSGNSDNWQDGQYLNASDSCDNPMVASSHTTPSKEAVFWVFYQCWVGGATPHFVLSYHWSADAGSTWSIISTPVDASSGDRISPSLHVLKEEDVSDITLAYRYEGSWPFQIRYIYKEDAQSAPSLWSAPYTGVNDYQPHHTPPQRAYTIRRTDNTIGSAVLYLVLSKATAELYFDVSSFVGIEDGFEDIVVIKGFSLGQNYPNPFNASTVIGYNLDKDTKIEIAVYNILGQKVKTLFEGYKERGNHKVVWDGTDRDGILVSSGVHFYRIKAGDKIESRKMTLMK